MRYSRAGRVLAAGSLVVLWSCAEQVTVPDRPLSARFLVGGTELLICPGGDDGSAEGEVSSLGGVVGKGRHELVLPAGAVAGSTRFRVTVPASQYMEINVKADDREGYAFGTTVQAAIDYSRCPDESLPATALSVWKIDPETKALLKRMPSMDDRLLKRVVFETDSLSSYSIAH